MNIYVGNLAESITEEKLRAAFTPYGEVDSVKVIKDKFTGTSRGFGFVTMLSDDEAQAAIDGLNGTSLEGRSIRVNQARPQEDRPMRRDFNGGGSNGSGPRRSFNRGPSSFGGGGNGGGGGYKRN